MKKIIFILILLVICSYAMCEITVVGHRGNARFCPENTRTSFEKAYYLGADILETDLRLTKDGKVVFIHDDSIDRTSNGTGKVSDMTLEELRKYDFCNPKAFGTRYKGEPIMTLEEGLDFIKDKNAMFFLELKEENVIEATAKIIKDKKVKNDKIKFLVWNTDVSSKLIKYLKGYDIYHLDPTNYFKREENGEDFFIKAKRDGITGFSIYFGYLFYGKNMTPEQINQFFTCAAKYNMPIGVWTVDEKEYLEKSLNLKTSGVLDNKTYTNQIQMITTNDVRQLELYLKK